MQEKLLKKMGKMMRFGHRFALTDLPTTQVSSIVSSFLGKKAKKKSTRRVKTYQGKLTREVNRRMHRVSPWDPEGTDYLVCLPHWDHLAPLTKAMCYAMAIPSGQRIALTLILTPEIIESALKSRKSFAGYFQDRLRRYLKNAVPPGHTVPDFVFVVEGWSKREDFHLQGAISLTPSLLSGAAGKKLRDALRAAGGVTKGTSTGEELKLVPMHEAAGWFGYLGKRRLVTAAKLVRDRSKLSLPGLDRKERLIVATTPLRRAGQKWYDDVRQSMDIVLWDQRRHRGRF
jgi:hypothetical protein